MKKWLLRIWQGILMVVVTLIFINRELVTYGIGQLEGQLHVINNARELQEVLDDPLFPDSLKAKLRYVKEIKRFAEDSLGLTPTENYSTVFDQKGEPILWVVTAAEPYKMEPYTWNFPLLGETGYKGFFEYTLAEELMADLKDENYDVGIREVTAWSTLGFFRDPILTNFLDRDEGQLANLIIHEMTHGTLFVPDSTVYNENLANFIGDEGAKKYLIMKYGKDSEELKRYLNQREDIEKFIDIMLQGANELTDLYASLENVSDTTSKRQHKNELIKEIFDRVKSSKFNEPERYKVDFFEKGLPNNTFFLGVMRYNAEQNQFEEEFETKFKGDFKAYFSYLKEKYPSI